MKEEEGMEPLGGLNTNWRSHLRHKLNQESQEGDCRLMQSSSRSWSPLSTMQIRFSLVACMHACNRKQVYACIYIFLLFLLFCVFRVWGAVVRHQADRSDFPASVLTELRRHVHLPQPIAHLPQQQEARLHLSGKHTQTHACRLMFTPILFDQEAPSHQNVTSLLNKHPSSDFICSYLKLHIFNKQTQ